MLFERVAALLNDDWKIEVDERRGVVKVQPLADWTSRDVWRYIWRHGIPYNSLHDHGYPSIGCIPCTTSVTGAAAQSPSQRFFPGGHSDLLRSPSFAS